MKLIVWGVEVEFNDRAPTEYREAVEGAAYRGASGRGALHIALQSEWLVCYHAAGTQP